VKPDPPERAPAIAALRQEFGLTAGPSTALGASPSTALGASPSTALGASGRGGRGAAAAAPSVRACPVEQPPTATPLPIGRASSAGPSTGLDALPPDRRAEFDRRMAEIDRKWPAAPRATVKDFVDEIDYAIKLIGIDHVGISSDFDGGGGIDGWNSAAESFNVTLELVRRGYTEEQIGKIWSGNLLRVWGDVEKVAKQIQAAR
jgi:membrane dipeptidase